MKKKYFDEYGCSSKLYCAWKHMKERCYSKNCKDYKNYGERGIVVCEEWKNDYLSFKKWSLANGYAPSLTLDRIDVDGNYDPSNCRWTTWKEQANNKRNLRLITFNGETKTLTEWATITGIRLTTLYMRLVVRKWPVEKALTTKVERGVQHCG